jgi:hypothetical protein
MSIQQMVRKITPMAAVASLVAATAASAAGPWQVSGWGTRNEFTFGGQVVIQPTGDVAGHFTIVIDLPDGTHSACRYLRFYRGSVSRNVATFYGDGRCYSPTYGWYTSVNQFTVQDNGSPGAGVDGIDVNFLGATGVAIPGGVLSSGDLTITP